MEPSAKWVAKIVNSFGRCWLGNDFKILRRMEGGFLRNWWVMYWRYVAKVPRRGHRPSWYTTNRSKPNYEKEKIIPDTAASKSAIR